jgi:Zn-dependent oligopeptidase
VRGCYTAEILRVLTTFLAISQVKKAKNFQAGMQMIRQLYFGAMDMHLHSNTYNPNGDKTVFQVR